MGYEFICNVSQQLMNIPPTKLFILHIFYSSDLLPSNINGSANQLKPAKHLPVSPSPDSRNIFKNEASMF